MIVKVIGNKKEVVRERRSGLILFRFDHKGEARLLSTNFPPETWRKILMKYKHIILEKTEEEKKFEKLYAEKKHIEKEIVAEVEEKKEKAGTSNDLDNMSEDEIRELG